MTVEEINHILSSTTRENWCELEVAKELRSDLVYKQDLLLTIKQRPVNYEEDKFEGEDWATEGHWDRAAYKVFYDVYYRGLLLVTKMLVEVDGGRARIPRPTNEAKVILRKDYAFARIVAPDNLDEYIKRSGLTVSDSIIA